jgi:hypothetical protein
VYQVVVECHVSVACLRYPIIARNSDLTRSRSERGRACLSLPPRAWLYRAVELYISIINTVLYSIYRCDSRHLNAADPIATPWPCDGTCAGSTPRVMQHTTSHLQISRDRDLGRDLAILAASAAARAYTMLRTIADVLGRILQSRERNQKRQMWDHLVCESHLRFFFQGAGKRGRLVPRCAWPLIRHIATPSRAPCVLRCSNFEPCAVCAPML